MSGLNIRISHTFFCRLVRFIYKKRTTVQNIVLVNQIVDQGVPQVALKKEDFVQLFIHEDVIKNP